MTALERLRQQTDRQEALLRAAVPAGRVGAVLALVRALGRLPMAGNEAEPDLICGRRRVDLGVNSALRLCLAEGANNESALSVTADREPDRWAEEFLRDCADLDRARLVMTHGETGFMRLVDDGHGRFDAWIATRLIPASWRERADSDWWAAWLIARHQPAWQDLRTRLAGASSDPRRADVLYRRLAEIHLATMAYQLTYPAGAAIDGCSIETCCDVLAWLIAQALMSHDRGEVAAPQSEMVLITTIALSLVTDPTVVSRALAALTLDRENAPFHAMPPGAAPPPLIRVGPDRLVLSRHGLTTQPLFFLFHELRRRSPDRRSCGEDLPRAEGLPLRTRLLPGALPRWPGAGPARCLGLRAAGTPPRRWRAIRRARCQPTRHALPPPATR